MPRNGGKLQVHLPFVYVCGCKQIGEGEGRGKEGKGKEGRKYGREGSGEGREGRAINNLIGQFQSFQTYYSFY